MLRLLRDQLKKAKLNVDTKLLLCVVGDTFDNFKCKMEQVVQIQLNLKKTCVNKNLFGAHANHTLDEIQKSVFDLDLSTEQNKELIGLIGDHVDINDNIASEVFLLAQRLKKTNFHKNEDQTSSIEAAVSPTNEQQKAPPADQKQPEDKSQDAKRDKQKKNRRRNNIQRPQHATSYQANSGYAPPSYYRDYRQGRALLHQPPYQAHQTPLGPNRYSPQPEQYNSTANLNQHQK